MTVAKRPEPASNPNFLPVSHGKMVINVPYSVFRDRTAVLIPEEWEALKGKLAVMYPWLTVDALDVIRRETINEMKNRIESSKTAAQLARDMVARDDLQGAFSFIEEHIRSQPEDADAWYVYGEVLMKLGRKEEGFAALAKARRLSGSGRELQRTVRAASEK